MTCDDCGHPKGWHTADGCEWLGVGICPCKEFVSREEAR